MVDPKPNGVRQEQPDASRGGHREELPVSDWARAVEMLIAKNTPAVSGSKSHQPGDNSADDVDVIRARVLSSQI